MKSRKPSIFLLVSTLLTLLAGCIFDNRLTPMPFQLTSTATLLTSTSIQTLTITPTRTFMPVQTLSPDDAYTRLHALLTDTANCRLPCWMGITPGESTLQEASEQLILFSGIAERTGIGIIVGAEEGSYGTLTIPYPNDNKTIEIRLSYQKPADENKVFVIWLDTRAYRLKDGEYNGDVYGYIAYTELLKAYSLSGVLSTYGPPSLIFIRSDLPGVPTPEWWGSFIIHIWYPEQGIFLGYYMFAEGVGENYRFCPSNAFISGTLIPLGHGTDFQEILVSLRGVYPLFFPPASNIKTPQEAFGMTIEGFYQLLTASPNSCLETPKGIWWP